MASNGVQIGLGVAVALVLGAGIVLLVPAPETGPAGQSATAPAQQPPAPVPAPDPAPDPAPLQTAAPRFDTFRVDPDGAAVIAGRAGPGQAVDILLDGVPVTRVTADASGSFAALMTLDPSDQARVLQLMADPDGAALRSEQTVMVAPFGVARAVPETPLVVGAVTDPGAQAPSPDTAVAEADPSDGGGSDDTAAPGREATVAGVPDDGAATDDRGGDGAQTELAEPTELTDLAGLADAPQTQDARADSTAPLVAAAEDSPQSGDADPVAGAQPQADLPQTEGAAPGDTAVAGTAGAGAVAPDLVDQAGLTGADGGAEGAQPPQTAPAGQDLAMTDPQAGDTGSEPPPAAPAAPAARSTEVSELDAAGGIPDDATAFVPESAAPPTVAQAEPTGTPAPPVALVDPPALANGAAATGQTVATAPDDSAARVPDATVTALADAAPAEGTARAAADIGPGPDGPGVTLTSPDAPQVLVADQDGVRVLPRPEAMTEVALDTITYDPAGEVVLAGRAPGAGSVRVYIDNRPVTTSRIAESGDWRTDLPDIETGIYTLRIDEIDSAGAVVSRIETPFKREEPEAVSAVMAEQTAQEGFRIAVRTVQPGATLWAIAEEELGAGIRYVAVYEANRDLIRDPDLIYPGQVFRIPEAEE